jgi:hypothetical protein
MVSAVDQAATFSNSFFCSVNMSLLTEQKKELLKVAA